MTKDAGIRVRVESALRLGFTHACKQDGRTAAEVLREFMVEYVDDRTNRNQPELFPLDTNNDAD